MNNNYYVYAYRDKDTENVFYVGMGKGRRAYNTYKGARNKYFIEYYKTHNCELFFIKKDITKEEAADLETKTVIYYHSIGQCYCNSTYNGKRTGVFGERNGNYHNGEKLKRTYEINPELKNKTKHIGVENGRARKVLAMHNDNTYTFDMVKDAAIWLKKSGISKATIQTIQSAISQRIKERKLYCGVYFEYIE